MTADQARAVMPRAPMAWLIPLVLEMPRWGIDTPHEEASFCAQIAVESAECTRLEENLNYSAKRLMAVWPRRFPDILSANQYAGNPEALANTVYGGRLGNGPAASGDGWRFRGRGPIQLTGRANYRRFGILIGVDLLAEPDLVAAVPAIGIRAACAYWHHGGLDAMDDDADARAETRAVNGGTTALAERQAYLDRALRVLA